MNITYLLLGGNLGDPGQNLARARELIHERVGKLLQESSLYRTAAWGKTDQPDFLNQVVAVETELDPHRLLHELLAIEAEMGRKRTTLNAPRIIDLDILYYNDEKFHTEGLTIPHPFISRRRFVLVPLNELAPFFTDPSTRLTVAEMLDQCPDTLDVKRI